MPVPSVADGALTLAAPAKINLDLLVIGRRPDGYHELDSLVVFTELADRLTIEPASELTVEAGGPFAAALPPGRGNIVARAATLLAAEAGRSPRVRLRIEKNLPVAAGIGGGSADAAATLRGLVRLWRLGWPDDRLYELALDLGADVPACLAACPLRMRGIGERLDPVRGLPDLPLLLVNPGVPVPTGEVFRRLGELRDEGRPEPFPARSSIVRLAVWLQKSRNDLEAPARALAPAIDAVLTALAGLPGCLVARMSGSGATCYGLFADPAGLDAAAARLRQLHPDWWVAATTVPGRP